MGRILLTPEETAEIIFSCKGTVKDARQEVNKAQLKKVRGKVAVVEIPEGKAAGYSVDGKPYIALAMLKEDWHDLLKELE